ncbi:hypothetical protein BU16DRAFT_284918 [Lophium mytilinum]|uniref:Uncharacterized protein n=1 Tax=Lophium mytilinum TaxID=390894 RepID=A0A6A6R7X9_9PEZI|nr:hypothetical protein BU16DRAFT_284918 [Lophium mytilinum]
MHRIIIVRHGSVSAASACEASHRSSLVLCFFVCLSGHMTPLVVKDHGAHVLAVRFFCWGGIKPRPPSSFVSFCREGLGAGSIKKHTQQLIMVWSSLRGVGSKAAGSARVCGCWLLEGGVKTHVSYSQWCGGWGSGVQNWQHPNIMGWVERACSQHHA